MVLLQDKKLNQVSNFILFKPPMDADEFVDKMTYETGVMVRNATSFGALGCIRVTIGTHEANNAFFEGLKLILGK